MLIKNLFVSHEIGLEKISALKSKYQYEIELDCLNSHFSDIELMKEKYLLLNNNFDTRVVLKESEFHEKENEYYECSFFCTKDELKWAKKIITEHGIIIDIIHDNEDI